jgi:hypothetical protein
MSGLAVGDKYQFEWWSNDSASTGPSTTIATAGNSVTLNFNTGNNVGGLGQFAIGTFTADATSEVISFSPGTGAPFINGFELRNVTNVGVGGTVPLPGALWPGLITVAALACLGARRNLA